MRGLVLAAIVVLAFACNGGGEGLRTATPAPSPSATPQAIVTQEPIRYSRGIYTIGPDGSGLTLLAQLPDARFSALSYSLSPSGGSLAFVAGRRPSQTIYLMGIDGEEAPRALATFQSAFIQDISPDDDYVMVYGTLVETKGLYLVATEDGAVAPFPTPLDLAYDLSWSPTGDQLLFFGQPEPDSPEGLYIMNSDGSGLRTVTGQRAVAAWSPDGSRIAYTLFGEADAGILLADREGNVTRVSNTRPHYWTPPAWAPDGRRIAFVEAGEREEALQITIVDVESGEEVPLTRGTSPAWSPDGSRIAFLRDGNLYVVNSDGSQETKVTNPSQPFVAEPSWLPDGSRLVFSFVPPFDQSVYVINPDGSDELRLADGVGPDWSPDGKRIAFVGGGTGTGLGGRSDIYVMNSDGTEVRKVAEYWWSDLPPLCLNGARWAWAPDSQFIVHDGGRTERISIARTDGEGEPVVLAQGYGPDWSPDGSRIAFSAMGRLESGERRCKLYLTNVEGEQTTEELTEGESPAWSPDGKRIAFSRRGALHVINADGTGERKLSGSVGRSQRPLWSSDGSRIVVSVASIIVADVEAGEGTQVALGRDPTWSPDGSKIAFAVHSREGPGSIYIVSADGSGQPELLTEGSAPAWSPDGSRIAFTR